MASRLELQTKLEEILGNRSVYYQPPSTIQMEYPAIVYSKVDIRTTHANNAMYSKMNQYTLIVIDKKPDNPVVDKLLKEFTYCSYDRQYKSDNLNHDVLTLYY